MAQPREQTPVPREALSRLLASLVGRLRDADSIGEGLKTGLLETIETEAGGGDPESVRRALERVLSQLRSVEDVIDGTLQQLRPPSSPFLTAIVDEHVSPATVAQELIEVAARDGAQAGALKRLRALVEAMAASELDRAVEIARLTEGLAEREQEGPELTAGLRALEERRFVDAVTNLGALRLAQPELKPRTRVVLELLWARLLSETGASEARIQAHLTQAEAINPEDGRTLAAISRQYLNRGEMEEAVLTARQAIDGDATVPDGFTALGLWALRQGDDAAAQEFFRQAVDRALQTSSDPRRALGSVLAPAPAGVLVELARRRAPALPEEALQSIDEALEDAGVGAVALAETYAFKADVLEQIGRSPEEVTSIRRSAADAFRDAGLYEAAERQLELALALDPHDANLHWDRAETVRLRAEVAESTGSLTGAQADELRLAGLAIWEHGAAERHPEDTDAWVYLTRGLLENESGPAGDWQGEWKRVAFIESNLVLYETPEGWAFLADAYGTLRLRGCALEASAAGYRLRPDDENVASAYVSALANLGRFDDEFRSVMDRLPDDSWKDALKAITLEHAGRPEEALAKLEAVEENGPLWQLECRARCRGAVGHEGATEDNLRILDHPSVQTGTRDAARGCAYYRLGNLDAARAALAPLRDDPDFGGDALCYLGLCDLSEGRIEEGTRELLDGVAINGSVIDLQVLSRYDVPALQANASPDTSAQLDAAVREVQAEIARRLEELGTVPPPEQEIQRVLAEVTGPDDARLLGGNATYARLLRNAGRASEAVALYDQLDAHGFPESAAGRQRCSRALTDEADALVRAGLPVEALARYGDAAAVDGDAEGVLAARRAYARFAADGGAVARPEFLSALAGLAAAGHPDPPGALAQICRGLLTDAADFWSLRDAWGLIADDGEQSDAARRDFHAACEALDIYLDESFGLGWSPSDERVPAVLPLAVELGLEFIPPPDTELPLIGLMAEMRDRIRTRFGIVLPGVHFSGGDDSMPPDSYVMLIHQARVEGGRAPADRVLAVASKQRLLEIGIPGSAIESPPGITVSAPGCLVAHDSLPELAHAGIEVLDDRSRQISAHIESVIAANLEAFFSVANLEELANDWSQQSPALAERVEANLIDGRTRVRLCALLRMLLAEQVPLTNPESILDAAHDWLLSDDRNLSEVLRATRLAVAPTLTGTDAAARRWAVPPELQAALAGEDDNTVEFLTAHFELLRQLREATSQDSPLAAVVSNDDELRPLIWRLIRDEFPLLPVLSATELDIASRSTSAERRSEVDGRRSETTAQASVGA